MLNTFYIYLINIPMLAFSRRPPAEPSRCQELNTVTDEECSTNKYRHCMCGSEHRKKRLNKYSVGAESSTHDMYVYQETHANSDNKNKRKNPHPHSFDNTCAAVGQNAANREHQTEPCIRGDTLSFFCFMTQRRKQQQWHGGGAEFFIIWYPGVDIRCLSVLECH